MCALLLRDRDLYHIIVLALSAPRAGGHAHRRHQERRRSLNDRARRHGSTDLIFSCRLLHAAGPTADGRITARGAATARQSVDTAVRLPRLRPSQLGVVFPTRTTCCASRAPRRCPRSRSATAPSSARRRARRSTRTSSRGTVLLSPRPSPTWRAKPASAPSPVPTASPRCRTAKVSSQTDACFHIEKMMIFY